MTDFLVKKFIKNHEDISDSKVRSEYGKLSGKVGIVCNILLFILKVAVGIFSSSVSIIADAVNNLSDASSSIISIIGFKLSEKPADAEHPYGHGRYEYLSAMSVAVIIIVIGFDLLKTGISKIFNPVEVTFNLSLVLILTFSIAVKLWMMLFNSKYGKKINSKLLIATAIDSRNDIISTATVLVSAIISHLTSAELDGWVASLVSLFILYSGYGLIKDTLNPLLGCPPEEEFIEEIRNKIMSYPGVIGMHDLIVHDYGPCRKFASVHIEMDSKEDPLVSHDIIDNIEVDFLKNNGIQMIVHYDPVLTDDPLTTELKQKISDIVGIIDKRLTIHDFRVVPGNSHTNLIFDCVAPFDFHFSDSEIKKLIRKAVTELDSSYNCVITIDKSFT